MSETELQSLKPGDRVVVAKNDGAVVQHTVTAAPWHLGTWLVGLDGIEGGYPLYRVIAKAKVARREIRAGYEGRR